MSSVAQTFAGLQRTPLLDSNGYVIWQWIQGFNQLAQTASTPANSSNAPSSSSAQGSFGQMATDGTFLYVCVGSSQWKRVALSAF